MKKLAILLLLTIMYLPQTHAVDLSAEIILSGFTGTSGETYSDASGTIFANVLDKKTVKADLQYRIGKNINRLNVAKVKFLLPKVDIIVGRQHFGWGSGYNFNPTDIFNSKPLGASFDPSYRKFGRDAIVVDFYPTNRLMVELVYGFRYSQDNASGNTSIAESGKDDFGLRIKGNLLGFDIAASHVRIGKRQYTTMLTGTVPEDWDSMTGLSLKGSLPWIDVGVWFEGGWHYRNEKLEFATGAEYFWSDWTFNLEYYQNGFGSTDKAQYNTLHLITGKTLARDYLVPSVQYIFDEKTTISAFAFMNMNDWSTVIGGLFDYIYNSKLELAAMPFVVIGKSGTEYGMQKDTIGDFGVQGIVKIDF